MALLETSSVSPALGLATRRRRPPPGALPARRRLHASLTQGRTPTTPSRGWDREWLAPSGRLLTDGDGARAHHHSSWLLTHQYVGTNSERSKSRREATRPHNLVASALSLGRGEECSGVWWPPRGGEQPMRVDPGTAELASGTFSWRRQPTSPRPVTPGVRRRADAPGPRTPPMGSITRAATATVGLLQRGTRNTRDRWPGRVQAMEAWQ